MDGEGRAWSLQLAKLWSLPDKHSTVYMRHLWSRV